MGQLMDDCGMPDLPGWESMTQHRLISPVVDGVMVLYEHGELTKEQAMEAMILGLIGQLQVFTRCMEEAGLHVPWELAVHPRPWHKYDTERN